MVCPILGRPGADAEDPQRTSLGTTPTSTRRVPDCLPSRIGKYLCGRRLVIVPHIVVYRPEPVNVPVRREIAASGRWRQSRTGDRSRQPTVSGPHSIFPRPLLGGSSGSVGWYTGSRAAFDVARARPGATGVGGSQSRTSPVSVQLVDAAGPVPRASASPRPRGRLPCRLAALAVRVLDPGDAFRCEVGDNCSKGEPRR